MPEDDPVAACRMELMSMPEVEVDVDDNSEFKADTELMISAYFWKRTARSSCCPDSFDSNRNTISAHPGAPFRRRAKKKVAPGGATRVSMDESNLL
jgi:hypothetical protein